MRKFLTRTVLVASAFFVLSLGTQRVLLPSTPVHASAIAVIDAFDVCGECTEVLGAPIKHYFDLLFPEFEDWVCGLFEEEELNLEHECHEEEVLGSCADHLICDPGRFASLDVALRERDWVTLGAAVNGDLDNVFYNSSRSALQVVGCDGTSIVGSLYLPESAAQALGLQ